MSYLCQLTPMRPFVEGANHFDEKQIEGSVSLRHFLAGCLAYHPRWLDSLYRLRAVIVRGLRISRTGIPPKPQLRPETVPFEVGKYASFFKVVAAQEDQWWVASVSESHLSAYLIVAAESLSPSHTRFHVGTSVHYHHWTGFAYFNLIRPFHHLVVQRMMRAGIKA